MGRMPVDTDSTSDSLFLVPRFMDMSEIMSFRLDT